MIASCPRHTASQLRLTISHLTNSSEPESESESCVTIDGQWASISWDKAPIWGLRPDFYYCHTVAGLLMLGALSDERSDLSFTNAAGPRQRSHSRIRIPWDSRPYFTVSDSRLPFSSPPTTRFVTVEVFEPTLLNWSLFITTLHRLRRKHSLCIIWNSRLQSYFIAMEVTRLLLAYSLHR
jgi:hypothetical protein